MNYVALPPDVRDDYLIVLRAEGLHAAKVVDDAEAARAQR